MTSTTGGWLSCKPSRQDCGSWMCRYSQSKPRAETHTYIVFGRAHARGKAIMYSVHPRTKSPRDAWVLDIMVVATREHIIVDSNIGTMYMSYVGRIFSCKLQHILLLIACFFCDIVRNVGGKNNMHAHLLLEHATFVACST